AVYAHLQKFSPRLERQVAVLQERQSAYALDLRYQRTDYPVRRGDLIAYTGDTGSISGPHLHFELRDGRNRPLNPLAHGFEFPDDAPPEFAALAVIPLGPETIAHGNPLPSVLPVQKIRPRRYVIPDTIVVSGPFGLAVEAFDRLPGLRYRPTLYGLRLTVDGITRYTIQFDSYRFAEGPLVELERDHGQWRRTKADLHRLFTTPHNDSLSFVRAGSRGILDLTPGYHRFVVKIWDKDNNSALLTGVLAHTPPSRLKASSDWSEEENGWVVSLDASTPLRGYHAFFFDRSGRQVDHFSHRASSPIQRHHRFVVPAGRGRGRIVQIVAVDRWGARLEPVHLNLTSSNELSRRRKFSLQTEHLDSGVIFQITSDYFLPVAPEILLRTAEKVRSYPTRMVSPVAFLSPTFYLAQLESLQEVIVRVNLDPPYEVRLPTTGIVATPATRGELSDPGGNYLLEFRPGTFYDSTFVWLSQSKVSPPKNARMLVLPTLVEPLTRPFKGPIRLQISVPTNMPLPDHAGIFYLDRQTGWEFMTPAGSPTPSDLVASRTYSALSTSGELFALLEETEPPIIQLREPDQGASYRSSDLRRIRFGVEDLLAGIKDETAISLTLDGQPRIFEYNTYRDMVTYVPPAALNQGQHEMIIAATDQLGNTATRVVSFYIQ
ncbi:MAG: hypothetical protein V3U35_07390, partial [Candidatus Neomarinimicrobiota bacterium]